jgi:hypothetical protein
MIIQKNIAEPEAAKVEKQKIESPVAVEPKSKVV